MAIPYRYIRKAICIGGSFLVTLPSIWVKARGIEKGSDLEIEVYDDRIVIRKKENGRS
jgi:antitoxin component of MazEF toxin-antitoxin module